MSVETTEVQTPTTETETETETPELTEEQKKEAEVTALFEKEMEDPDTTFKLSFFEKKIQNFLKLQEQTKKKSQTDFQEEAQNIAKLDEIWSDANTNIEIIEKQLEGLKEVRKNKFQEILNEIYKTYEATLNISEETKAAFDKAQLEFNSAKNLMKSDVPGVYNHLMKKYGIRTREVSPKSQTGTSQNGVGEIKNISGFVLETGGMTFSNTGSLLKHTGGTKEDFIKAFIEAQGTDNRKNWQTLSEPFTFRNFPIIAKTKVK